MLFALTRARGAQEEAVDQARRAWQAAQAAEDAEARVRADAERTALRVSELESALAKQAAAHETALAALTAERDDLRSQIVEVREGKRLTFSSFSRATSTLPWV